MGPTFCRKCFTKKRTNRRCKATKRQLRVLRARASAAATIRMHLRRIWEATAVTVVPLLAGDRSHCRRDELDADPLREGSLDPAPAVRDRLPVAALHRL